jgi:hypothetical protein
MNLHTPFYSLLFITLLAASASVVTPLAAQEHVGDRAAETSVTVPALREFHTVIFKLWHTAWPNKDYDMLTGLVPEIEQGVTAITNAELPGMLREKKTEWRAAVDKLRAIAAEYKTAVEARQEQPLLDAAEKLHAQYENVVRVLRSPLKELDEFHAVLYMLYHYSLPEDSLAKVKSSVEQLQEKMAALNKATLPPRFKEREASFTATRNELDKAVASLAATMNSNDSRKIKAAVETMHSRYEALSKVLE